MQDETNEKVIALYIKGGDLPVIQKAFFRNLIAFFVACGILMKNREKIVFPKGRGWIDLMARPFFGRQVYLQTFMPLTTLG